MFGARWCASYVFIQSALSLHLAQTELASHLNGRSPYSNDDALDVALQLPAVSSIDSDAVVLLQGFLNVAPSSRGNTTPVASARHRGRPSIERAGKLEMAREGSIPEANALSARRSVSSSALSEVAPVLMLGQKESRRDLLTPAPREQSDRLVAIKPRTARNPSDASLSYVAAHVGHLPSRSDSRGREPDDVEGAAMTPKQNPEQFREDVGSLFRTKSLHFNDMANNVNQAARSVSLSKPLLVQMSAFMSSLQMSARSGSAVMWVVLALLVVALLGLVCVSVKGMSILSCGNETDETAAQERFEASKNKTSVSKADSFTGSECERGALGKRRFGIASSRASHTSSNLSRPFLSSDEGRHSVADSWFKKLATAHHPTMNTQSTIHGGLRARASLTSCQAVGAHIPDLYFTVPVDTLANVMDDCTFPVRSTNDLYTLQITLRNTPEGSYLLDVYLPSSSQEARITIGPVVLDQSGLQRMDIRGGSNDLYGFMQLKESGEYAVTAGGQVQLLIDDNDGGLNLKVTTGEGGFVGMVSCIQGTGGEEDLEMRVRANVDAMLVVAAVLAVVLLPQRQ